MSRKTAAPAAMRMRCSRCSRARLPLPRIHTSPVSPSAARANGTQPSRNSSGGLIQGLVFGRDRPQDFAGRGEVSSASRCCVSSSTSPASPRPSPAAPHRCRKGQAQTEGEEGEEAENATSDERRVTSDNRSGWFVVGGWRSVVGCPLAVEQGQGGQIDQQMSARRGRWRCCG